MYFRYYPTTNLVQYISTPNFFHIPHRSRYLLMDNLLDCA